MKKTLLLFVLVSFFSKASIAQIENINLNNYKLTDYRYTSLGTNLSLNGLYDKSNADDNFFNVNNTQTSKSLNSNFNLNYLLNISNRKYIGYHSILGGYNHNFSNSTNDNPLASTSEIENISTNYQLSIISSNSFYLNENFFWGLNFRSNCEQQNRVSKVISNSDPSSTNKDFYSYANNRLSLQIGYGRVENVTDARQAIYIFDELNKKNRLTHEPTPEEAFEFADFITYVLNKRVIDSREKRIEEYTLIDSFLVSKGLIAKQDGKYFGILSDNWNYARTQLWHTGSRVYLGAVTKLNYRHQFSKETYPVDPSWNDKYTFEVMNKGAGIEAGYELDWIEGLKWINSFNCNISFLIDHYDPYNSEYTDSERNQKLNLLQTEINYSLSFVPNTRSVFTGHIGTSYDYYKDVDNNKVSYISPFANISCTYYFSQKLQINAFTQVNYYKMNSKYKDDRDYSDETTRASFGVGINYYFF